MAQGRDPDAAGHLLAWAAVAELGIRDDLETTLRATVRVEQALECRPSLAPELAGLSRADLARLVDDEVWTERRIRMGRRHTANRPRAHVRDALKGWRWLFEQLAERFRSAQAIVEQVHARAVLEERLDGEEAAGWGQLRHLVSRHPSVAEELARDVLEATCTTS